MDYMEFASDLPLHQTIMFSSAEENKETMKRWDVSQEIRQIGTGKFRSDLVERQAKILATDCRRVNFPHCFSHYTIGQHGVRDLDEAGDV